MKFESFAKVNLGLDIKFKRSDGYHELHSIMVMTTLSDTLSFEVASEDITVLGMNIPAEGNLIYRVAQYVKKRYDISNGAKIVIEKRIPLGGGLGGGSSNAASTIMGLNKLWNLQLSTLEMHEIAIQFGADIPYCLYGKPAFVSGIGEKIDPIKINIDFKVIIVKLPYHVSTKEVFENMSASMYNMYDILKVREAFTLGNKNLLVEVLGNNMEEYTVQKHPEIAEVKKLLVKNGCFTSIMSGSGATVLGLIDSSEKKCLEELKKLGYKAWLCDLVE